MARYNYLKHGKTLVILCTLMSLNIYQIIEATRQGTTEINMNIGQQISSLCILNKSANLVNIFSKQGFPCLYKSCKA